MRALIPVLFLLAACADQPRPAIDPATVSLPQAAEQCAAQPELDWC